MQQKYIIEAIHFKNSKPSSDEKVQVLKDEQIAQLGKCPFQCRKCNDHMHYMECDSSQAQKAQNKLIKSIKSTMTHYEVHDAIQTYLIWGMTWNEKKKDPIHINIGGDILDDAIQNAIKTQAQIGWSNPQ